MRRIRISRLALVAILAVAAMLVVSGCKREVPKDRRFITDTYGRALILHGANVASAAKSTPDNLPLHTQADVSRMGYADWGMNLSRYLMQWQAIEPEPGTYDDAYLDAVATRMRWHEDAGVKVVLDMHQDIFGPAVGGNGAPPWATRTGGLPDLPISGPWWLQYLQPRVWAAFNALYATSGPNADVRDHYVSMWRKVAERFRDDPAVLGYDLINEPFPGSRWAGFEPGILTPFYQEIIDAIREVDPDSWIFVEPISFGPNQGLPSRLAPLTDPRVGDPRIAYFPHLYTIDVDLGEDYDGNTMFIDFWATSRSREVNAAPMPMLIGEFGRSADGGGLEWIGDVLDMADQVTSGWAYWSYEIDCNGCWGLTNSDGSETPHVPVLVRTYARAVAGHPQTMSYDAGTHDFSITFDETGVDAPTEIFVPATRHYPGGFDVAVSDPDGTWTQSWDAGRQILEIRTDPAQTEHTITITPS